MTVTERDDPAWSEAFSAAPDAVPFGGPAGAQSGLLAHVPLAVQGVMVELATFLSDDPSADAVVRRCRQALDASAEEGDKFMSMACSLLFSDEFRARIKLTRYPSVLASWPDLRQAGMLTILVRYFSRFDAAAAVRLCARSFTDRRRAAGFSSLSWSAYWAPSAPPASPLSRRHSTRSASS